MEETRPLLSFKKEVALSKPSPWYIIIPIFALAFSFGSIIAPTVQVLSIIFCYKYYEERSADDSDIPLDQCNIPEVQSLVSETQAVIMFLGCASALLLASYYGVLSDRRGRRCVMQISMLGGILFYSGIVLTLKFYKTFDVFLLYLGPILRGLLAGESVLFSTANAYLSDCTTANDRTLVFGRMIAAIYLGTTLGPSFSSFLIKQTGTVTHVFYMAILIHVGFLLYVTFVLPESKEVGSDKEKPRQSLWERVNVFSAFAIFYRTPPQHANRWALLILAVIHLVITMLLMPPVILYGMLQFGWTAYEGGLFISLASFTRLLIVVCLVPIIVARWFSVKDIRRSILLDTWLIRAGLTAETVAMIAFGLATTSTAYTITGVLQGFAVLAAPSVRSLATLLVDRSELGELWGAMATLEAFANILSQVVINAIYSASVSTMPYLAFFFCAGLAGMAALLAFFIYPTEKVSDDQEA
ncbi:hypothetical protein G6F57_010665 [Rhizopus arrhizus]|uniref:Major facilitator superfamily (MFS) profile domain-containing protein n=1 Tax=Rhizopus oryzae TaxID=64495 RepID=A0A9P7BNR7_RHIOR|nr:hypothetical protein G6F24_011210 [Rhizopus arrhizus]KAG0780597.1 hypothetical protein G6F22_009995 [Rhizopus arrhizus]KAG0782415.1 hypothetical protein G6F21_011124 [Rhizopus arrhizus]KAG0806182.1 hypothetical protein G6F20_011329 [Rhizopus arrhizus]KAG0822388.1 hypothetical protein G6F19_011403 [Rhizopus arrhizus]